MSFTKGHTINKGRVHTELAKENMRAAKVGEKNPQWSGGKTDFTCEKCNTKFTAQKKTRRFCSLKCASWKGDEVGYTALHQWVYRYHGKADHCEACTEGKNFTWANISREYARDISDWVQLCRGCHVKYDRYGYTLKELGL